MGVSFPIENKPPAVMGVNGLGRGESERCLQGIFCPKGFSTAFHGSDKGLLRRAKALLAMTAG